MEFSIKEHTVYFAGYLDAVGRVYSNDKYLYGLSARRIPNDSSLEKKVNISIIESKSIKNMVVHFEKAISELLKTDPRQRLLFYLIDYFSWFQEFSDSCVCEECVLSGEIVPENYKAFMLHINGSFDIFILLSIQEKE